MSIATLGLRSRTGLLTNISFGKSYYDNDARILIERLSLVVTLTALQKKVINDLILDLKGIGSNNTTTDFWTSKITKFYGMIGGVALSHLVDFRNPNSCTLRFYNSPTHSSLGVATNGSNYIASGIIPKYDLSQNDCHIGMYVQSSLANYNGGVIGSTSNVRLSSSYMALNDNDLMTPTVTSKGHHVVVRSASNVKVAYHNGSANGNNSSTSAVGADVEIYIGGLNLSATFSIGASQTFSTIHIGTKLTAGEISTLYNSVILPYQTALSRN